MKRRVETDYRETGEVTRSDRDQEPSRCEVAGVRVCVP